MRLIGMLDSPYVRRGLVRLSERLERTAPFQKYPSAGPGVPAAAD